MRERIVTFLQQPSFAMRSSSFRLSSVLITSLLCGLLCGCSAKKKQTTEQPLLKLPVVAAQSKPAEAAAVPKPHHKPKLQIKVVDEADMSCSYFYFLWGRHAEMEMKYEAALEAYEKALICDPEAEFVISKLPQLLLRMGRSEEAAGRIKEHLEKHPDDAESHLLLAKIFIRDGKLEEAAEQCRKAHDLNPKDAAPLLLLSELQLAANKKELAKTALEDALETDSTSASAHLLLARLLAEEEKFAKALEHYRQVLAISPSEGVKLEMADVLVRQKKYNQAAKTYKELLAKNELDDEARIGLIHVYLLQNKEKKAASELQRLKELVDSPEQAELTVAKLYIRWEEPGKAAKLLNELLQKEKNSEASYLLGALYFQEKKYEDTLKTLAQIDQEDEEYEDGLVLHVRTLRQLKRQEEAIQLLDAALTQEPLAPEIWTLLAGLQQEAGQEEAYLKTFDRALKAHPGNELLQYEQGLALEQAGKKKQALTAMQRLLKKNPDHAGALNYVGYNWAESNINLNKAFLYLSRAKELKPQDGSVRDSLGWVYYRLGNFEEARKTLEEAAKLSPEEPAIFDHLAETHRAAGRRAEAVKAWRKALELFDKQKETAQRAAIDRQRIEEKINRTEKENQ
jgi:tetratricopeptide (TPR) repeat protein